MDAVKFISLLSTSKKFTRIFYYILVLFVLVLLSLTYKLIQVSSSPWEPYPIAIWWTPFTPYPTITRTCSKGSCVFVHNHDKIHDPSTEAVLFYGSQFKWTDLPLPRDTTHYWSLFHEESPKNNWGFADPLGISLFNLTSTFSRHSTYPLTAQYLDSISSITTPVKYPPARKSQGAGLGLVMYLQSGCGAPSDRDSYVTELKKYVTVDSYGKCIHNKDLPKRLVNPVEAMDADELLDIIGQYKFMLAFENAICEDYITEKLWRTFKAGSVPVYKGSPSVKDWEPSDHSMIHVDDFKNPKQLADYLNFLNDNDAEYEKYLSYKIEGVSNQRLIKHMQNRDYYLFNNPNQQNMVEGFECAVCNQIHKRRAERNTNRNPTMIQPASLIANHSHYDCLYPRPSIERASKNFKDNVVLWRQMASLEGFRARAVVEAVRRNTDSNGVMLAYSEAEKQVTYNDFNDYRTKDFIP